MGRVLISPLNWGLGHATRDIPLIRTLLAHGHEVTIAASGNARLVLEQEFPGCTSIDFPDYAVPESAEKYFLARFALSFPLLLKDVATERRNLSAILSRERYDLIISDNRLGVYSDRIPSLFITHQLRYHIAPFAWPIELAAVQLNTFLFRRFDRIIVPDNMPGMARLAGKLSRADTDFSRSHSYYAGIMTGMRRQNIPQDLDYLFIISGPEPMRTGLERMLLPHAADLPGSVAVLLGSPSCSRNMNHNDRIRVIPYASTEEKELLMNRARCIICRSGYTTMMELAELEKTRALLIPTPGQTEQEYLATYYEKNGWFHGQEQHLLDFTRDLEKTGGFRGFPAMPSTDENMHRLYDEILAGYLE